MLPGTELTAQDCLYMGKHSFNLGLYLRAIQWFEEAYTLAGHEGNVTVTQEQVNLFLNTAIKSVSRSGRLATEDVKGIICLGALGNYCLLQRKQT